jgi:hypothetical protein
MMIRKSWISFLLLLSLFVVPADLFAAGSERMKNVVTEIKNQEIVVTAELVDGFSREILNDIHDGIPKDFYYYLLLKRKQKNWFDEEILAKTIRYTVKYDTLKKKYSIVQRDGERVVESTVDDVETMKRLVSKIDRVKLAPTRFLKSRNRYYVSVKSQMKAAKLPFYVDYFLFFIPFLELDTPWADSDTLSVSRGG